MPNMELYLGQADLLRQDLARMALQIEEAARLVRESSKLPLDLATRIKEIDGDIKQIELEISSDVQTATIGISSTLQYPNEGSRKTEIAKRVRDHPDMPEHLRVRRELENEKRNADDRHAGATESMKAYTIVSQLRTHEVLLLAAQIHAVSTTGETLEALEKFLVGRIGESFQTGRLGTLLNERVMLLVKKALENKP